MLPLSPPSVMANPRPCKILNVAEKNDAARGIATILSGGRYQRVRARTSRSYTGLCVIVKEVKSFVSWIRFFPFPLVLQLGYFFLCMLFQLKRDVAFNFVIL